MFYSDGLDFKCKMCSYCCSSEPGYVFLSEKDIDRLSRFLALDRETFLKTYTRQVDYGTHYLVSLTERKNYDCEFLSSKGCTVYDARPEQCRTYPFWKSVLENRKTWENEAQYCKGINGGRKVSKKEIDEFLKRGENNPPFIIFKHPLPKKG